MSYPFELKPLNYSYDALEPFIDKETIKLHHDKHLRTFVTRLNHALETHTEFHSWCIEQLISNSELLPNEIRTVVQNNSSSIYNHTLFFNLLTKDSEPPIFGLLYEAIKASYNSTENFKAMLKTAAIGILGSGWAWLVSDKNGKLSIVTTANQDVPDLDEFTPIINLHIEAHAYGLKNQNCRSEYIDNFFRVIDWEQAEENYMNR